MAWIVIYLVLFGYVSSYQASMNRLGATLVAAVSLTIVMAYSFGFNANGCRGSLDYKRKVSLHWLKGLSFSTAMGIYLGLCTIALGYAANHNSPIDAVVLELSPLGIGYVIGSWFATAFGFNIRAPVKRWPALRWCSPLRCILALAGATALIAAISYFNT